MSDDKWIQKATKNEMILKSIARTSILNNKRFTKSISKTTIILGFVKGLGREHKNLTKYLY